MLGEIALEHAGRDARTRAQAPVETEDRADGARVIAEHFRQAAEIIRVDGCDQHARELAVRAVDASRELDGPALRHAPEDRLADEQARRALGVDQKMFAVGDADRRRRERQIGLQDHAIGAREGELHDIVDRNRFAAHEFVDRRIHRVAFENEFGRAQRLVDPANEVGGLLGQG